MCVANQQNKADKEVIQVVKVATRNSGSFLGVFGARWLKTALSAQSQHSIAGPAVRRRVETTFRASRSAYMQQFPHGKRHHLFSASAERHLRARDKVHLVPNSAGELSARTADLPGRAGHDRTLKYCCIWYMG